MAIKVTDASPVAPAGQANETSQEDRKPPSVRDSIKSAFEEVRAEEEIDDKKEINEEEVEDTEIKASDEKDKTKKASDKKEEKEEAEEEIKDEEVEDTTELKVSDEGKEKQTAPKAKAPPSLPKEVAENWAKIPSTVQSYITKSQKEISDTKAELGRKVAQYRDMDQVLAHYEPAIRQHGVSPAQTVDRLFQWMHALAGPQKELALQQLAVDFQIDLSRLTGQQQDIDPRDTQDPLNSGQLVYQTDPNLVQTVQQLQQQLQEQGLRDRQAREHTAEVTISSWAGLAKDENGVPYYKNKPHYDRVRPLMFSLLRDGIQTGAIPLIDGKLDLDTAYERACYATPEIRAEIERETNLQKARDAKIKAKQQKEAVEKAKSKNLSIRPNAPGISNVSGNQRPNGAISVRDSIRSAVAEVRDNT